MKIPGQFSTQINKTRHLNPEGGTKFLGGDANSRIGYIKIKIPEQARDVAGDWAFEIEVQDTVGQSGTYIINAKWDEAPSSWDACSVYSVGFAKRFQFVTDSVSGNRYIYIGEALDDQFWSGISILSATGRNDETAFAQGLLKDGFEIGVSDVITGTVDQNIEPFAVGSVSNYAFYDVAGSYNFVTPDLVNELVGHAVGAGASGSGRIGTSTGRSGSAGGSAFGKIPTTPGEVIPLVVGQGGAAKGGSTNVHNPGGTSSVTAASKTITATGGIDSFDAGVGIGGDVNFIGTSGNPIGDSGPNGGNANGPYGGGGGRGRGGSSDIDAYPGERGGGGGGKNSNANSLSGAGGDGFVILFW